MPVRTCITVRKLSVQRSTIKEEHRQRRKGKSINEDYHNLEHQVEFPLLQEISHNNIIRLSSVLP